jgi:exosortase
MVLVWIGIGASCYGARALSSAVFPLLFLFLMIPIPSSIMDNLAVALQKGSAEVTAALFKLSGMPFSRHGLTFSLPTTDIEIGKECSGIRSAASLFISGILASYVFLRSQWSRLGFALLTIPVVILKNAVRIATISWLGVRVDGAFFAGNLHHHGGLVFFPVAVVILLPVLVGLRKMEGDITPQATLR